MAEASAAGAAPLLRGLPDEIVIWEIFVRLPPKSLLRCRAVSPAWRRTTSTHDFLLAHHARQPTLPLLREYNCGGISPSLNIVPLDHWAGVATMDQLQSVVRLAAGGSFMDMEASCDGLLVLAVSDKLYCICNPATREYAPLPLLGDFCVAGMYLHAPTGEYRLLLYPDEDELPPGAQVQNACYVYALGSCQPPRHIVWPEADQVVIYGIKTLLFRGNLHWYIRSSMILVFDTTTELFRKMRTPAAPARADLFEMDGMLGMASFNDAVTTIDIWMTQDYDAEVWAFKYRVELPVAELRARFGNMNYASLVVSSWDDDDDVLILVQFGNWLLQIDIDGKLVASFHRKLLGSTQFRLKQTLVPHTFFPTIEGYVVNTWPFISPDVSVANT